MDQLVNNILTCQTVRTVAADAAAELLANGVRYSESNFCDAWAERLLQNPKLHKQGWYSPPPMGISALFAAASYPQRLLYDNLRKEEFWPKDELTFANDSIGLIYASPVGKESGIIGDFGMTIYSGPNEKIHKHLSSVLQALEKTVGFAAVGMELREVHQFCQSQLAERGLNNQRTVTYTDKTGTNVGHTIPWTYELPTAEELEIINGTDFDNLKNLISSKRINLNQNETFKIPENIAFTVEVRAESNEDDSLPNTFFHIIVAFVEGKKMVFENFNPVFQALGMDKFIKAKYS